MRYLVLSIISVFLCLNCYSQSTIKLPRNTPAYIVLNNKTTTLDSLSVREYSAKETDSLIKQINKAGDKSKSIFPWKDVVASIKEQEFTPIIIDHRCEACTNNTTVVYFVSPTWTWEKLCGRAGYLIICPHCMRQIDFSCTVMN